MDAVNKWLSEIDQNPEGFTDINIAHEFERIFSRNIIEISFGEDISDEKFEVLIEEKEGNGVFKPKMVSIRESFHE